MIISKTFRFEASHVLPKHEGKCSRLHGHSWVLIVSIEGPINTETGFVADYGKLKNLVDEEIVVKLDHTHLGYGVAYCQPSSYSAKGECFKPFYGDKFYPSSENLAVKIGETLTPYIQELGKDVRIHEIIIEETCTSRATWRPDV